MEIEIRPINSEDAETLLANMRQLEKCSWLASIVFDYSYGVKVATVDGEPAAAWGVYGDLIDPVVPWLVTTPLVERYPVHFLRESRRQLTALAKQFGPLRGFVECDYVRSARWLEWLGVKFGEIERPAGVDLRSFTWQ